MYKNFRQRWAEMSGRFEHDYRRARSLYDGGAVADAPENKRLVRQTGAVLILFGVLFIFVALSIFWLVGRLSLLLIAFGGISLMGGIFQLLRGKVLVPARDAPTVMSDEQTSEANAAAPVNAAHN